ncbi:MAG: hypothetical protein ACXABK_06095, partial [Candidatus Heimdallarchaeaceae archaeon]
IEVVALYQYGALVIVNLLIIFERMFRTVYTPIIFKYFERGQHEDMQTLTRNVSKMYGVSIIGIGILLFAFSPLLVIFFTNASYLESIYVIPILLVALMFNQVRIIMSYGHTLYYKTYWAAIGSISGLIISAVVGYFIIPRLGLIGIGIVYVILRVIQFVFLFTVSQRYFKVNYRITDYLKLALAAIMSIGIGVVFYFYVFVPQTNNSIILSFTISLIIYIGLVILLKLFTRKDLNYLMNIFLTYRTLRSTNLSTSQEESD